MDELNKRDLDSIHRVVTKALMEIKLTPLWQRFLSEDDIGRKDGNNLQLSKKDHKRIREITQDITGRDPILPLLTGSRLDVSKYSGNEKLGSEAPSRHHLLLNSPSGLLKLNTVEIPLMVGSSYRSDWRNLDLKQLEDVIVVENLQAFDYIQQAQLPEELNSAWVLYRGHNESSKAVIDLLNALPENCHVIGFADYDPAGFKILLTSIPNITHCLLPELSENLFDLAQGTRPRFQNQQAAVDYIENNSLPIKLHHHWQTLMQYKLCISQELMFAQTIKLSCLKFV
jgi:hypothetical protein